MKRISLLSILGFVVLVVASPFIAIPRSWKDVVLMLAGLAIIVLSVLLRKELHKVIRIVHGVEAAPADTYVENNPQ